MNVQQNTVVSVVYRFLDEDEREIHNGQLFKTSLLIGRNHAPYFIEKELMYKKPGDTIRFLFSHGEILQFDDVNLSPFNNDIVEISTDRVPDGIVTLPGMIISFLDSSGSNQIVEITEVSEHTIKGIPIYGNPRKPQYIEITIQSVRWATPEEFIEGRPQKSH